jgi:hypothetical protein
MMETDQMAAEAQCEARKKAAKEAREAEKTRIQAVLYPRPVDQKAFKTKFGVTFNAKKCLDSECFKDRWITYCGCSVLVEANCDKIRNGEKEQTIHLESLS